MLFARSVAVLCALAASSQSNPFHVRRIDLIGTPYRNLTSISTSSSTSALVAVAKSTATGTSMSSSSPPLPRTTSASSGPPPYPIQRTGTDFTSADDGGSSKPADPGPIGLPSLGKNRTNGTSPSCTVNIPSASIDWWFAATYSHQLGKFTQYLGNLTKDYITLIPNTVPFDASRALETEGAWTETTTYISEFDETWTYFDTYAVRPSAAITSTVTRTAVLPLPSGDIIPAADFLLYGYIPVEPASLSITGSAGAFFVATSTTPVLYFSAYEVETAVPVAGSHGRAQSSTTTETVSLTIPYAFPYWVKGIEDHAIASGSVPEEFLQQISHSSCGPGTVQATVTVVFVVDLFYQNFVNANPFIVHIESSALGFEDPTSKERDVQVEQTGRPTEEPITMRPISRSSSNKSDKASEGIKTTTRVIPTPSSSENGDNNAQGSQGQGPDAPEPTTKKIGTIENQPVVIGPSSIVYVGPHTLNPGGPAITVGGVPVSLAPSATVIVVGGITSALPNIFVPSANPRLPPILTIGPSTLTANAATQFFIGPGQTLTPGGTATVGGTVVTLDSLASFIVIGGSTQALPTAVPAVKAPPEIVVGESTFIAIPGSTFVIGEQTLAPGQVITVDGTAISLGSSASFVVVGKSTQFFPTARTATPEITVAGSTFRANPGSSFVIDGQTLTPGQEITIDGTTISLGPLASFVVINGATSTLANPAASITAPPLTIGNGVFTALPGSGTTYRIGGFLLTPGGAITVADSTISLAPGATALIINGKTTTLLPGLAVPSTNPPELTIGSETYIAQGGTTFIISGQTLTPGGTITIDDTTISLAPGATQLVFGSSGRSTTTMLFPATRTEDLSVTKTDEPSAGATGTPSGAAATSPQGAGYSIKPSGLKSWVLSVMIAILGMLLV